LKLAEPSKPNEEKPQESTDEVKEQSVEETPLESEEQAEETSKEPIEEKIEETPEKKEKEPIEKTGKTEPKEEEKKEKTKKKAEHKDDFKYIVRIANTDLDGEKTLIHGLTSIKGIGMHMSSLVTDKTGFNRNIKIGDLTDAQIEKIKETLESLNKNAPSWMVNHRKDLASGDDIHLIASDIDMRLRDEINVMKKIRSYRGVRHEQGLPVRGQRTRANNRKGLSLGVSRKVVKEAAAAAKSESKE
jgi:small subunit ribosomal protein S13